MKEESEESPYDRPSDEAGREEDGTSDKAPEREMSFLDHLEELRWRIIYSMIGVVVGAIVVWIFIDPLMNQVLLRPATQYKMHLQNLRPFGQVLIYMQVALFGGILLSIPNIIFQIWKFISPGLYPRERRYISLIVVFTSLCFLAGVAFAYFFILPSALKFFAAFGTSAIDNIISVEYYFDFVITLMLGAGLVFELPMLSFFLSRLGILSPKLMRKYWRHAMIVSAFTAALISPGPDPVSMLMMAIPLVFLYEISIWISKFSQKKGSPRNV
ncbi:MAG: twin-arginine translocase subunit TatC [Bacteroidota bacterium]